MQMIGFTKMHGAGNDYIYVNTLLYNIADPSQAAARWSDRHTGIGSDGLVLIGGPLQTSPRRRGFPATPSLQTSPRGDSQADFSMRIFNADGSEAMMCGNACRCIGKYLYERGLTRKTTVKIETLSGVKTLNLHLNGETVESVTVDMGVPVFEDARLFNASRANSLRAHLPSGTEQEGGSLFVSMGNPHFVVFVEDLDALDINGYGYFLEKEEAFPERCNIEFARLMGKDKVRVRVWERGSGITMACGTGACATAVAAAMTERTSRKAEIVMDGGSLQVEWNEQDGHVYLSGPAEFAFDGIISNE